MIDIFLSRRKSHMRWQKWLKPHIKIIRMLFVFYHRYTEMLHCWAKEPNKRPSFSELANTLQDISTDKPALSKTSFIPLDHFAIPDSDVKEDASTELNGEVIGREKTESNEQPRTTDSIILSDQPGDTKL